MKDSSMKILKNSSMKTCWKFNYVQPCTCTITNKMSEILVNLCPYHCPHCVPRCAPRCAPRHLHRCPHCALTVCVTALAVPSPSVSLPSPHPCHLHCLPSATITVHKRPYMSDSQPGTPGRMGETYGILHHGHGQTEEGHLPKAQHRTLSNDFHLGDIQVN